MYVSRLPMTIDRATWPCVEHSAACNSTAIRANGPTGYPFTAGPTLLAVGCMQRTNIRMAILSARPAVILTALLHGALVRLGAGLLVVLYTEPSLLRHGHQR